MDNIKGKISLSECRKQISMLGKKIESDISSTYVNKMRITSLRALLDLFEEYNDKITGKENNKSIPVKAYNCPRCSEFFSKYDKTKSPKVRGCNIESWIPTCPHCGYLFLFLVMSSSKQVKGN